LIQLDTGIQSPGIPHPMGSQTIPLSQPPGLEGINPISANLIFHSEIVTKAQWGETGNHRK